MVILGLRHMRKKGLRWHDVLSLRKPPLPPRSAANMSDRTLTANDMHSGDDKGLAALTPPRPTMSRLGSSASQQPLILQRQDKYVRTRRRRVPRNQCLTRHSRSRDLPRLQTAVAPAARSDSFLLDESPHQSPQHTRNRSNDIAPGTATSGPPPPLPLKSAGPTPALQQSNSDNAAPPTFRQFLTNRRSTVPSRPPNHFTSRFSWTNSAAPQTPRDAAHRDTALGAAVPGAGGADMPAASGPPGLTAPLGRDSFMTQRSSLPRFRTVNSWVNQQASRFEEGKLREQQERQLQQLLQHRQSEAQQQTQSQRVHLADENSSAKSGHPRGHPDASAALETDFQELAPAPLVTKGITNGERAAEAGSPSTRHAAPSGKDAASPPQQSKAQPSHARQDTASTAPIFRHHPGDEVRISVRSHVPSEVFENNMRLSVM